MSRLLVVELFALHLGQLALVVQFLEEVAGHLVMRGAGGAAVDIERDAEALERVLDEAVVAVHHLLHGDTLLACADGHGHAVLVRAAHEHHVAAPQAQAHTRRPCDRYGWDRWRRGAPWSP